MKKDRVIIFIPGYKGSTLVDQEGDLVWPNLIKAQFDCSTSLSNDLPSIGLENPFHYESTDIVKSVTVIPGLYKYDVYGQFLISLQKALPSQTKLLLFHYDWRQDLLIAVEKLRKLIEEISRDSTVEIDIICHSMGGLITTSLMQMIKNNAIRHVYFVAVPFRGALPALLDLRGGSKFGFNKTLLSAKAMSSFSSPYYLLPRYPEAVKEYDIFDIETWKRFNIGYLANEGSGKLLDFLEAQLDKVNKFYQKIETGENKFCEPKKLIFINNLTRSTQTQIQLGQKTKVISSIGDGTVPRASLELPDYFKQFNHETHHIDTSHALSFSSEIGRAHV